MLSFSKPTFKLAGRKAATGNLDGGRDVDVEPRGVLAARLGYPCELRRAGSAAALLPRQDGGSAEAALMDLVREVVDVLEPGEFAGGSKSSAQVGGRVVHPVILRVLEQHYQPGIDYYWPNLTISARFARMESELAVRRRALVSERIARGLSINAAAKAIGVAPGTLNACERGESLSLRSAKRIADFYGCKVADLMPADDVAA